MAFDPKSLLSFLKLSPRYFVAVAIICAALLFGPQGFLDATGLAKFTEDYRPWIGLAFLIATVLPAVHGSCHIAGVVRDRVAARKADEIRRKRLESLTEDEKEILRHYVSQNTKTHILDINNGVANGLVSAGLIYRSADISVSHTRFAHNITEFAWEHLQEQPGLVDPVEE